MRIFSDDEGRPVNCITAEQHALDNPGHKVFVALHSQREDGLLDLLCDNCGWWDQIGTFVDVPLRVLDIKLTGITMAFSNSALAIDELYTDIFDAIMSKWAHVAIPRDAFSVEVRDVPKPG